MRRNLPSACTAQRGSVCQSTQVVQKLYKRLYKKPHELPSFRFLWPCIVSKIWREKTNKLQQLDVYLSNKNQLDATLCSFYFCGVTLHVSAASAHHQEYLKLVQRPLVHVLSLQVSSGPNKVMWWLTCNDNTCTSGRCTSFKYSWWWALAPETRRVTPQK